MGFGGVLAFGCTVGQGITGVSTLGLGSFATLVAILVLTDHLGTPMRLDDVDGRTAWQAEADDRGGAVRD